LKFFRIFQDQEVLEGGVEEDILQ